MALARYEREVFAALSVPLKSNSGISVILEEELDLLLLINHAVAELDFFFQIFEDYIFLESLPSYSDFCDFVRVK